LAADRDEAQAARRRAVQLLTGIASDTQMHHFDADLSSHDESPATHHVRRRQHRRMHLRLARYHGDGSPLYT
jgi:hypothetical protein